MDGSDFARIEEDSFWECGFAGVDVSGDAYITYFGEIGDGAEGHAGAGEESPARFVEERIDEA